MSDTTSLPTQDSDPSDDGLLSTYVIRITPHDKFTFEQVAQIFKDEPLLTKYVLSKETVPREHYHAVIQCDISVEEDDIRGFVKSIIIPYWEDPVSHKLPRGFGNKQYNLQISQDVDKAVSYAVKQGDYVFEGFEEHYILSRKTESFDKKKTSNFKSEYRDLCQQFQESTMDLREFMVQYVLLKSKYDQMVNIAHAYGYAISQQIKREKDCAEEFVENFLYKV